MKDIRISDDLIPLSEIISQVTYHPLPTERDYLIGEINKIMVTDSLFFIVDKQITQAAPVVQVLSISSKGREEKSEASGMPLRRSLAVVSLAALVPLLYWGMRRADIWQARHDAAKEWRNVRTLYHMEAYSVVCEDYAPLYERMRWNHNYLFEYGRALHQTKKHEESNRILEEAEQLCGDPMILNIQGKNHEAMGEFDHAALLYQRAYHRLPNRLYPLYLEMLMYASQVCNQPEGAKDLAKRILDTKEKIPSKAVEEMKMKAKEILTHPLN